MSALPESTAARFRPMVEADLPEIMQIELSAYPFPWTEGILRDCLRVGYNCWVYEADGAIQGYTVMSVAAGEAHILNLCVRPAMQGQGLGRKLLNHSIGLARRHGADTLLLEVRPSNEAALGLYRSMGFNDVGMRRGYYPAQEGREDALILALALAG